MKRHDILPHIPASVPALPVCAGTVAGVFWCVALDEYANLAVAGCVFALAVAVWFLHRPRTSAFIAFVALGMAAAFVRVPMPLASGYADARGVLTGKIAKADLNAADNFIIEDATFTPRGGQAVVLARQPVSVRVFNADRAYRSGEIVSVSGRLQSVADLNRQDVPYSDDYAAAARVKGFTAFVTTRSDSVRVLGYEPTVLQRIATGGNAVLRNSIADCGFDDATAAFVLAVLAGDETFLDADLTEQMRVAGVAHVLALSGLHVGIIATLFAMLLCGLRCLPKGRLIYALALPAAVLLYGLCVGMPPSVARAAVMLAVFAVSGYLERPSSALNALLVTVTVWLFINPMWLWSPAMQLSCAAVAGVIIFGRLAPSPYHRPWLSALCSLVLAPIGALVATSLLSTLYFHVLPVWFLPANIAVGLLVPVILTGAAIATVCVAAGLSPGFLPGFVDRVYALMEKSLDTLADLPHAQITGLYPDGLQLLIFAVAVAMIFVCVKRPTRLAFGAAALTVAALVVSSFSGTEAPETEVYVPADANGTPVVFGSRGVLLADAADTKSLNRTFRHLVGHRQCDSILAATWNARVGTVTKSGPLLRFDGHILLVADNATVAACTAKVDYLLVTDGYRGDIVSDARRLDADTVLLTRHLNTRLRRRYSRELDAAGLPSRDISRTGWHYLRH